MSPRRMTGSERRTTGVHVAEPRVDIGAMNVLRLAGGKIAEQWIIADMLAAPGVFRSRSAAPPTSGRHGLPDEADLVARAVADARAFAPLYRSTR
jgi:hypothetical protein